MLKPTGRAVDTVGKNGKSINRYFEGYLISSFPMWASYPDFGESSLRMVL